MQSLSLQTLFTQLQSFHPRDIVFAAEELGARGDRAAVAPLIATLATIKSPHDEGIEAVAAVVGALAAIGDPAAIGPIVEVLRIAGGVLDENGEHLVSEAACRALIELRATAALPALRQLQCDSLACLHGGWVARALVELGGAAEIEFFCELLQRPDVEGKIAAVEALGRLRHQPSAAMIEPLLDAAEPHLRLAALGALLALDQPGAEARLRFVMLTAATPTHKTRILAMLRLQSRRAQRQVVLEMAGHPHWVDSLAILFDTLELAVELGSAAAVARVRQIFADRALAASARARAAAILLHAGAGQLLPACLEFVRSFRNHCAADWDPRDSAQHLHDTRLEVLSAIRRHAQQHREARPLVAKVLYTMVERGYQDADDLESTTIYLAGGILYEITGTTCSDEYSQWIQASTGAD
jgi:hypothetical protein